MLFFILSHYAKGYVLLILPAISILLANVIVHMTQIRLVSAVLLTSVFAILLFTLSPFIPPAVESSLAKDKRSSGERLETAILRTFSFFGATNAHIREAEHSMVEARAMLDAFCKPNDLVFVDASAGAWAYPRSLQVARPDLYFIMPRADGTVSILHDAAISRGQMRSSLPLRSPLYFLIDNRLPDIKPLPPSLLLAKGERISLMAFSDPLLLLSYLE
jgi:hypothetical protein